MLDFLEGRTEITDIDQLKPLEDAINDLAKKQKLDGYRFIIQLKGQNY